MSEDGDALPTSKKLFINHVDTYQGLNLGKYLAGCLVGASLDDVEEEEEEAEETQEQVLTGPKPGCYQVVGTLKDPEAKKPDFVKEIFQFETREQLFEQLVECDVIVYDITDNAAQIDEAAWAVSEIHADLEHIDKQKIFILVSSVMTWARSKPLDPDDPEIPFTEDDYRRRKPHPNFKEHLSCEKTVIKVGKTNKSKLITYVIASGIPYGAGENIFHYLYKSAWHNAKELFCFGNGQNVLPTIHIRDLGGVIQNIADMKPKARYIVATDDSQTTLEEIVKGVSTSLGTGAMLNITKEDALLQREINQDHFDMLLSNLRMDSVFVKENMKIRWVSEAGIVENLPKIVKEYRESRKLLPMRVCVLGPPAVGKTAICAELAKQYKLHHIKVKDVIDEAMSKLEKSAARADKGDEEDDDGKAQDDAETLEAIRETMESNNGRIDDTYVIKFFRDKLKSMPCQNQGFLLDGFPKTNEQAKELFAPDEDAEEEDDDEKMSYDKTIMPEAIILLEAPDDFLRNRIMNLAETMVSGTHNDEEGLNRRLNAYRDLNQEDDSVINYFDELEIFPDKIDVSKDTSKNNYDTVEKIKKIIGEPRNYGPTDEEREEMRKAAEEARLKREAEEKAERERAEYEEATQRWARQQEWAKNLEQVKKEEYELLEAQSIPLRNYLMKHVMPTLTKGLIECCQVRPEDSVDFLAEYLFQNNPQID